MWPYREHEEKFVGKMKANYENSFLKDFFISKEWGRGGGGAKAPMYLCMLNVGRAL